MTLVARFLIALAMVGLATSAEARPDARTMTCAQAISMVKKTNGVVMTTGTHTFERYVANGAGCRRTERPVPAYTQTKDKKSCRIGFRCKDVTMGF